MHEYVHTVLFIQFCSYNAVNVILVPHNVVRTVLVQFCLCIVVPTSIAECGQGLVLGQGNLCDSPPGCAEMVCAIKAKIGHFIENLNFTMIHDDCAMFIYITINGHEFNISYKGDICGAPVT